MTSLTSLTVSENLLSSGCSWGLPGEGGGSLGLGRSLASTDLPPGAPGHTYFRAPRRESQELCANEHGTLCYSLKTYKRKLKERKIEFMYIFKYIKEWTE